MHLQHFEEAGTKVEHNRACAKEFLKKVFNQMLINKAAKQNCPYRVIWAIFRNIIWVKMSILCYRPKLFGFRHFSIICDLHIDILWSKYYKVHVFLEILTFYLDRPFEVFGLNDGVAVKVG